MIGRWVLLIGIVLACWGGPAAAVQPDEILDDPKLEERAREISKKLRCLVCQNQSIDDSEADLARDLRLIVRERLQAGDSNGQVLDYVVDRYGVYVLLDPPVTVQTYLLWFGPLILLVLAGGIVFVWYRNRPGRPARESGPNADPAAGLTAEEKARLERILKEDG